MSVLETPRILFRGQLSWDPITTNNYSSRYDEDSSEPLFDGDSAQAFRQSAIDAVTQGNWNPHGTHRSTFYDTMVSAADTGGGPSQDDPFVGAPVAFSGMLVDSEPYGAFSSQLFFDAMSFGIEGGCRIHAPRTSRFTARYINFARNPANAYVAGRGSVVWQSGFAKSDGLIVQPRDSAVLAALVQALAEDDVIGLTIRWNAYYTVYYASPDFTQNQKLAQQLQDKLDGGGFQPNPARSKIVGMIGLWRRAEPAHEGGDRALLFTGAKVASAQARVDDNRLTLDLSNSIPETDLQLTKADLGPLSVVVDAGGKVTTLGTFGYDAYDRAAYEAGSGLVILPLDPGAAAAAAEGDLELRKADGTVLLSESGGALRAIPGDPNLYIDEGETVTSRVQLLDRGKPAGAGIQVTLGLVGASTPAVQTAMTDGDGVATFDFSGATGNVEAYVLMTGDHPVIPTPDQLNPQVYNYMYVRTLGADRAKAQLPPTWENVYANVLINWHAMAPCMDNWLDLGDPDQVRNYGSLLKRLTAKDYFEGYRYMPVTRDLTAGERTLLYRFLDGGPEKVGAAAFRAPEPAAEPGFAELSGQMRNH